MQNRIRELRKQHRLTMKQLGNVVDLAESTISQYETGKRQPDNEVLLKLSEYFGVSVDYLIGRDCPPRRRTSEAPTISTDDMELLRMFHDLDERGQAAVLNTLNHEYNAIRQENAKSSNLA